MKDMPALLCAVLSVKDRELLNAGLPTRDRQREDAAHFRADHALGCGGS